MADRVVKEGITHVLTKMGIMGIRLKIAIKNAVPPEFELMTANSKDNVLIENTNTNDENTNTNDETPGSGEILEKVQVREEVNQ